MADTPVIASETDAAVVVGQFLAPARDACRHASIEAAAKLMAEGVVWHVQASSPIADDERGRDRVPSYLRHRRRLAGDHLRVTRNITKRARNS
jgi:hypothetical protein